MQVARDICEYCGERGQTFTLETGQEPANVLDQFIADVGCENLKINFDPANMILYGTGNPIEALRVLIPHVISVHCKDGDWPATTDMHALGKERPLGQGSVNIPKFVQTLKEVGYTGILSLEREELNAEQRAADIRSGIALLKRLV
jgi:sugar phosphate isomerase/epimerase